MSLRRLRRTKKRRKVLPKGPIVSASSKTGLVVATDLLTGVKGTPAEVFGAGTDLDIRNLPPFPQPVDVSGAASDEQLVELWLHTGKRRSEHTRRAYRRDAESFRQHLAKAGLTLRTARVRDVQLWFEGVPGKPKTRARRLGAVRSLFTFATKTGYLGVNVGAVVEPPQVPNELAERILSELEVQRLIEKCSKNLLHVVRFMYATGARIHEACEVKFKHVHFGPDGTATVTLHGKGGKTRHVPVAKSVAAEIYYHKQLRQMGAEMALTSFGEKPRNVDDEEIFWSKKGLPLHPNNVTKQIRRAAKRAGIERNVSAHWLRHAHASHALDHGAPAHVVQQSLGHASLATTGMYAHVRPGDGSGLYLGILK